MGNASDHLAIQAIISRYSSAVTRRDWISFGELFAEEAVWEVIGGPGFRFSGQAIAPGIRGIVESTSLLVQVNSPALIELNGDRAVAQSTIYEYGELLDKSKRFEEPGIYDDVLVRREGHWQFLSRRFTILGFRSAPISE